MHFSAVAGKYSPVVGYNNRIRLNGLIYSLKSSLQLNIIIIIIIIIIIYNWA